MDKRKGLTPPRIKISDQPGKRFLTKKGCISAAITLVICGCGWCKTEALGAEKTSYQKKPTKVSRKDQSRRAVRTGLGNVSVYNQLEQIVDLSALTVDTTFSEAIEILRDLSEPPLRILVLWRNLSENSDVDKNTPIYIQGVSGIPLHYGLELLLMGVSGSPGELGYAVKKGIIIIATKDSLSAKMVPRIYDISDLTARPANYGFNIRGGFAGGWAVRGANRGIIGQRAVRGNSRGRRAYGRGIRQGTRGRTTTVWAQSRRVRGPMR